MNETKVLKEIANNDDGGGVHISVVAGAMGASADELRPSLRKLEDAKLITSAGGVWLSLTNKGAIYCVTRNPKEIAGIS